MSLADELAPIASLLSAAAGPAGAVKSVADFLDDVTKAVTPLITDDETQRYADERTASIQQITSILSEADSPDRQQRLGAFFSQLLLDAGQPIPGGVGDVPLVGVRVEFLLAVGAVIAGKIYDDKYLTAVLSKATTSNGGATSPPGK